MENFNDGKIDKEWKVDKDKAVRGMAHVIARRTRGKKKSAFPLKQLLAVKEHKRHYLMALGES